MSEAEAPEQIKTGTGWYGQAPVPSITWQLAIDPSALADIWFEIAFICGGCISALFNAVLTTPAKQLSNVSLLATFT